MEWREKVALLEKGVSPDGLPINPPRKSGESSVHGWFSYTWVRPSTLKVSKHWYRIGPREE